MPQGYSNREFLIPKQVVLSNPVFVYVPDLVMMPIEECLGLWLEAYTPYSEVWCYLW